MEQNSRVVRGRKSFSQAHQDLFVVAMTNEKRAGSYVELGSGHPFEDSNTALLELDYGWEGVSWELDSDLHRVFGLRPGKWCNFPVFERRIVDVRSHRGMVSE